MEIEIDSKKNNPLLNRTEICFTVRHEGGSTPNREIIRSELAEKLNVKKENIIVNAINTSFGIQETTGYAKIYSSVAKAKDGERRHILERNLIGVEGKKKEEKKTEEKPVEETPKVEEPPKAEAAVETTEGQPEAPQEPTAETPQEEKPKDETPKSKLPLTAEEVDLPAEG